MARETSTCGLRGSSKDTNIEKEETMGCVLGHSSLCPPSNLCLCYVTRQRESENVLKVTELEMEKLTWIIWVGPILSSEPLKVGHVFLA